MQLQKDFRCCARPSKRAPAQSVIHARLGPVPRSIARKQLCRPATIRSNCVIVLPRRVSRKIAAHVRAALPEDNADLKPFYAPFSVELLLAVARLGHLERYRQEIQMFFEPGAPADLTRCALLITNIFSPQLDHRLYYTQLEDWAAAAAIEAIHRVSQLRDQPDCNPMPQASTGSSSLGIPDNAYQSQAAPDSTASKAFVSYNAAESTTAYAEDPSHASWADAAPYMPAARDAGYVLDPSDGQHLLCAITAISEVLFEREGLAVNSADAYDPLNGSLADVMDRKTGNQYSLAIIYVHVASALGLPCAVVGSPEHILVRLGDPYASASSSSSHGSRPAVFLLDVSTGGTVYEYSRNSSSSSMGSSRGPPAAAAAALGPDDQPGSVDDQWQQDVLAWLRQQQQQDGSSHSYTHDLGQFSTTHSNHPHAYDQGSMLHRRQSSSSMGNSNSSIDSFAVNNEDDTQGIQHGWQDVEGYAAADAASRNSWKALYGSGALTEWGGLVSSSSYSSSSAVGDSGHPGDGENHLRQQQFGGQLASPFAAAAHLPFEGGDEPEPMEAGSSSNDVSSSNSNRAVSDSMDTACSMDEQGQPLEDLTENTSSDEQFCSGSVSMSYGSSNSQGTSAVPTVLKLSDAEVQLKYGNLQPVSSRVLLQQMLAGMKLSLIMSGRDEEALAVIRYLRATDPFSLPDLRDEGVLLAQMQQHEPAVSLLREYLAVAPGAADAEMVREVLEQQLLAIQLARSRARRQQ